MRRRTSALPALVLPPLLLIPGVAGAEEAGRLPAPLVEDGRITMTELTTHTASVFRGLDGDADGVVSEREFMTFHLPAAVSIDQEDRTDLFAYLDEDGDGVINAGEWTVGIDQAARLVDLDKDGYVSLAELAEMRETGTLDDAVPATLLVDGLVGDLF